MYMYNVLNFRVSNRTLIFMKFCSGRKQFSPSTIGPEVEIL